MNIFDAIAYSVSNTSVSNTEPSKSDLDLDLPDEPDFDTNLDMGEDIVNSEELGNDELFADNPEEDLDDPGYSGSSSDSDEFSTSFLELDAANPADPYSTSFQEIDDGLITDENDEVIDESWTQDILDDIDSEKKKSEPQFSETSSQEPNFAPHEPEPEDPFVNPVPSFTDESHYETTAFQYEQDKIPGKRHWFVTLLFILANLALIATLLGQAVWFHYEKLAKYPKVKEYYQLACEHLSCTLPKLEDITRIKSNNLIVRSHPTQRKSLIIDTVIVNQASFDQTFPDLALYFSDINKNIVAQRLFKPNEYLSGELANWTTMPSQQPIHISLEIVDPGKEAVNYTLKFFSPDP
jgi:hypothetical protein